MGSIHATCSKWGGGEGGTPIVVRWQRPCPVHHSRESFPHKPPLFSCVLGRKRTVFTFGGINSSISGEELKNAVRAGDVFDNRYPEREALFICMLGSLSVKNLPAFLSFPSYSSSSPSLRKINSVIMILVNRILFKATWSWGGIPRSLEDLVSVRVWKQDSCREVLKTLCVCVCVCTHTQTHTHNHLVKRFSLS